MLLGLTRILLPQMFDKLVVAGFIQFDGPVAEFLDHFSPSEQGLFMILAASLLVASGFGMLRLGKYLLRGLRFLFSLLFDRMRGFAQSLRRKLGKESRDTQRSHEGRKADCPSAAG
jgi:hypothetical protein